MYKKLIAVAVLSAIFSVGALFAQSSNETQSAPAVESKASVSGGIRYIAAALAVGIACIGGGYGRDERKREPFGKSASFRRSCRRYLPLGLFDRIPYH